MGRVVARPHPLFSASSASAASSQRSSFASVSSRAAASLSAACLKPSGSLANSAGSASFASRAATRRQRLDLAGKRVERVPVLEAEPGGAVAGRPARGGARFRARFRARFPAAANAILLRGAAGFGGAAAFQIVGVAAGMRADPGRALEGEKRGHRAVEEIAVVADDQNGAVIIGDHLLKQVERLHVEIVRRLVEDQEIMRLGEQLASSSRFCSPPDRVATFCVILWSSNRKSRR